MAARSSRLLIVTIAVAVLSGALARAQTIGPEPLRAAREQVLKSLVVSLPAQLPEGAIAILPPQVPEKAAAAVDPGIVTGWATAMAEMIHQQRPDTTISDREHLNQVLREQKFGDSAYADPSTAAAVGKLVAARLLLLTKIHQFQLVNGQVRVNVEVTLIDVETSENLWANVYNRGLFPLWAKLLIAAVLLLLALIAWRIWRRIRKKRLLTDTVPRTKAVVRVDVDGLVAAATAARQRLHQGGEKDAAMAVQQAWVEVDTVLDSVRHALPGGAMDRSRIKDLKGATAAAERLAVIINDLHRQCDQTATEDSAGNTLAEQLAAACAGLRANVDDFNRHQV